MKTAKKVTMVDVPEFKSEKEEAQWWDTHAAQVDDFIDRAEAAGAVERGIIRPPEPGRPTTIRLVAGDVERARAIAERKGIRYQTYLKMLIHEALQREEKAS